MRVEYIYDAAGMNPVSKVCDENDSDTWSLNLGTWESVWFIRNTKPCMLLPDGTVDYYLDPDDYSKKIDGTDADTDSDSYTGNAMAQIPLCWVYRYEDDNYLYEIISNVQWDENYKAYAHTDDSGTVQAFCYHSIFPISGTTSKFRSLPGTTKDISSNRSAAQMYSAAQANGSRWYIDYWMQANLFQTIFTLLTKSCKFIDVLGQGFMDSSKTRLLMHSRIFPQVEGLWKNGTVSSFYVVGFHNGPSFWYVEPKPPFKLSTYSGLKSIGKAADYYRKSNTTWIKSMSCSEYGLIPTSAGGSASTYFGSQVCHASGDYHAFILSLPHHMHVCIMSSGATVWTFANLTFV